MNPPVPRAFPSRTVLAAVLLGACLAHAQVPGAIGIPPSDPVRAELKGKLEAQLDRIDAAFQGILGVELIDLTDGTRIGRHAGTVFPTASTIKVAILAELYRQAEHDPRLLARQLPFAASTRTANDGLARLIGPGSRIAVGDLARLMINLSENTATNLLIDEAGMDNVNAFIDSLGLRSIRLQRHMLDAAAERLDQENLATPEDGAQLMARIARCDLPLRKDTCATMLKILEIPKDPFPATDPIPRDIVLAFKPGDLDGVLNGWGYVELPGRPYAFAIMSTYGTDNATAVRAVSAAAFEYFSRLVRVNRYGARVAP